MREFKLFLLFFRVNWKKNKYMPNIGWNLKKIIISSVYLFDLIF